MKELAELWHYREVLWNLVRRNLKVRYKNSVLGFLWSLLNPLMQIAVWYFVFKIILGNPEENYMAFLITGFLPWLFFSQSVLDSTMCVTQEMALIKKAYFPRVILPLSSLFSNLIHLALAFVVLLGLFAIWRVDVNVHYLLIIPSTLLIALFAYGLSAMLGAWSVFYGDVKFIVGNLLSLWFFLTPVLYSLSGFLNRSVRAKEWLTSLIAQWLPAIKTLYFLDPVAIGIVGYRSALLNGGQNPIIVRAGGVVSEDAARTLSQLNIAIEPGTIMTDEAARALQFHLQAQYPMGYYIIGAAVIAVAVALIGHLVFRRMAHLFAERG